MRKLELEYNRVRSRISTLMTWADGMDPSDEHLSELATYINILVSGYIEARTRYLITKYVSANGAEKRIKSFVEGYTDDWHQPSIANIRKIIGYYGSDLRNLFPDHDGKDNVVKAAIDSIVLFRNKAAHGRPERRSLSDVKKNYSEVVKVFDKLEVAMGLAHP